MEPFYAIFSPPGGVTAPTLFLHERTSPAGHRRLVAVSQMQLASVPYDEVGPYCCVFIPAGAFSPPVCIFDKRLANGMSRFPGPTLDGAEKLVVFAGQPDAVDASHFTIRALEDGSETILDGWLKDDDSIILEARRQPASMPAP
jgi:hypothetical protein